MKLVSKGMLVDGAFATEAVDSSGEQLSVKGCNIVSLPIDGTFCYEHKKPEQKDVDGKPMPATNGEEIVGRIIFARKIFGPQDCQDDRQLYYWNQIKFPYIYGVGRLADGAGHSGALALAAHIRDHHAHGEPVLVRFSIEGNTLEKKGNVLERTVARRVAITLKPCNRSCFSGMLYDPNAPAGFEKEPSRPDPGGEVAKSEALQRDPSMARIGGSYECDCLPPLFDPLAKATEAGSYDAAPSTLTGGSALQREDEGLSRRAARLIQAADSETFRKDEFRLLLRAEMPEVADEFLDRFADVADSYHAKLRKDEGSDPLAPTPLSPEGDGPAQLQDVRMAPAVRIEPGRPARWGDEPTPLLGKQKKLAMDERGNLTLPSGQRVEFHVPKGDEYMSVLHPDAYDLDPEKRALYQRTVHEPWERAMSSWMALNDAARDRRVPRSVVRLAALFAAQSPNTAVPLQERHYGHVVDMINDGEMPLHGPITQGHLDDFTYRATGPEYPRFNREHFEAHGPPPGIASLDEQAARAKELNDFGNPKSDLPQVASMRHLDEIVPYFEHVLAEHGDDARAAAARLMNMKVEQRKYAAASQKAKKERRPLDERYEDPRGSKLPGFGPKLSRYALTMMGMGNCLDGETEALTTRGWVKGFDLKMGDVLLTKNPRTMALEWQLMTDLKLFPDYEGPLVELKSRSFHAITTPDHRWLVTTKKNSEGYGETVRERTSSTLTLEVDKIHRTGDYDPQGPSALTPDQAEMLGWFVTDGYFTKKRSRGGWGKGKNKGQRRAVDELYTTSVYLCQSMVGNPEKCARIDALLDRLDLVGEGTRKTKKTGERVWRLSPCLASVLKEWAPDRVLTVRCLLSLNKLALLRLREAMILGDGSSQQHKPNWTKKFSLGTGRKEQADAFQVLLTLTGAASVMGWVKATPRTKSYASMKHRIPQTTGYYGVREHVRKYTTLSDKKQRREFFDKIPVWCPVVPNTFFVARRDGQVWITGNTIVPDRHMIRSLYGLRRFDPTGNYLATETFTNAQNEPLLTALDRHFFLRHPAVGSVLRQYPEHFKGREEQAIFPAFWKHWLALPHYEENLHSGDVGDYAKNGGTDHKVFWDSIQDAMRRHGIPVRGSTLAHNPDTSFDFGENVEKSEGGSAGSLVKRAVQALEDVRSAHGGTGMLAAYFLHVLPAVMDADRGRRRRDPNWIVRKAEAATMEVMEKTEELKKALRDLPTGKNLPNAVDYSHLLAPEHRAAGYGLAARRFVEPIDDELYSVSLLHRGAPVGHFRVTGDGDLPYLNDALIEDEHRGKGLGRPMFEAALLHGSRVFGARKFQTGQTSTAAYATLRSLAAKHGFDYSPRPSSGPQLAEGAYDGRWAPTSFFAKSEVEPRTTFFAGNPVVRGSAATADGKFDLLHEDDAGYVAVPEGAGPEKFAFGLTWFPRELEGSHYRVLRRPAVAVADL